MESRWGVAAAVAAIMLAFAGNSVMTRYIVLGGFASAYILTTVRFASGFAILLLLRGIVPSAVGAGSGSRADLVGGFLLGAYAFSISFGYSFISAAAGTLVFYAFVVLSMSLFAVLRDRERPTLRPVAGQALAMAGVGLITFGGIRDVTFAGVVLMAATGISWGLYSAHGRSAGDAGAYTFQTFLVVGVFSLGLVPPLWLVSPNALHIDATWNGLGLALFMGTISTALSYVLWHATLRRIRASQGGIVQLTVPVLASAMGVLLLGELLSPALLIGGAAVLVGIYLNRGDSRSSGEGRTGSRLGS